MITLAFIGRHYGQQVRTSGEQLSGLEVVYCGDDLHSGQRVRPRVLVLDLDSLGADPLQALTEILASGVERVVVAYTFARRDVILSLQRPGVQLVQGPLSLSNLRALMTDLLIRDILADSRGAAAGAAPVTPRCPKCGTSVPLTPGRSA